MNYYLWFLIALILFIFEILTPGFVVMWFGIGAFAVAILDLIGIHDIIIQGIVFAIVSLILVIYTRKIFVNFMNSKNQNINLKSQVESLVGKTGLVTLDINNSESKGRVFIEGQDWSARSENNELINQGEKVVILRLESAKLIVKKL